MKKLCFVVFLGLLITSLPVFSSQTDQGFTGLFKIKYPFTLHKGVAAFTFGVNNVDLETGNIDVNIFSIGATYAVIENLELNVNFSYNRVKKVETGVANFEYPFAERWQEGLGYASVGVKYNFLKGVTGLGLLGHLDLPLADELDGVSTGNMRYGVALLFAHKVSKSITLALNAGYTGMQEPDNYTQIGDSFKIGNYISYAGGIEIGAGKLFSFAAQLSGKIYSEADNATFGQENPLDIIVGVKYEDENYGISVAYKKNLAFEGENLGDTHGAMGSIWLKTNKPAPPIPPCVALTSVSIKGAGQVYAGEVHSYQATILPSNADNPVYTWECSGNGEIVSGQSSPTISLKWNTVDKGWVKVSVSNPCSSVSDKMDVEVAKQILPPDKEYFFAFDSYEITPALKTSLDAAVSYYKHHPESSILVLGFTCSIATDEYNLALGEHRASAVKQYLIDNGISGDRIKTVSYGEAEEARVDEYDIVIKAYSNDVEEQRKKNRRVYIPLKDK